MRNKQQTKQNKTKLKQNALFSGNKQEEDPDVITQDRSNLKG